MFYAYNSTGKHQLNHFSPKRKNAELKSTKRPQQFLINSVFFNKIPVLEDTIALPNTGSYATIKINVTRNLVNNFGSVLNFVLIYICINFVRFAKFERGLATGQS